MTNKREKYIDAIKVFALSLVFALHSLRGISEEILPANYILYYFARCSMPMFFMVNGYLMLSRQDFDFSYYKKKVFNIIRILMIWGIIGGLYSYFIKGLSLKQSLKDIVKIFVSHHWYMNTWFLVTFIIIYTILLFGFKAIKKHYKLILIVLGIICLIIDYISLKSVYSGGYFIEEVITQRLRLFTWCFYFTLGYALGLYKPKDKPLIYTINAVMFSILSVYFQYYVCFIKTGNIQSNYVYNNFLIIVWISSMFIFIKTHNRLSSYLSRFAPYSFGAFLMHSYFIDFFNLRQYSQNLLQSLSIWILLTISCFLLSYIFSNIPHLKRIFSY